MAMKPGCTYALIVAAVCGAATIALLAAAYSFVRNTFVALDIQPKPLPVPEVSEELERQIAKTEETFRVMIDGHGSGEIVINADVLNGWLRMSPRSELRFIGEHAWFNLDGDTIKADLSLPLDPLGAEGRYFNGRGVFKFTLHDRELRLVVVELVPDPEGAKGLERIVRFLGEVNIAGSLGIDELLGSDTLERCRGSVEASTLTFACTGAPGSQQTVATPAG